MKGGSLGRHLGRRERTLTWEPAGAGGLASSDGASGCVSSSLGPLASIIVKVGGGHPEGPGAGQGWQKAYLPALGSGSFPDGLAVVQYLSQPVVRLMAHIAIYANIGVYFKKTAVLFLLSLYLFCTNEAGEVKDAYRTQSGPSVLPHFLLWSHSPFQLLPQARRVCAGLGCLEHTQQLPSFSLG